MSHIMLIQFSNVSSINALHNAARFSKCIYRVIEACPCRADYNILTRHGACRINIRGNICSDT